MKHLRTFLWAFTAGLLGALVVLWFWKPQNTHPVSQVSPASEALSESFSDSFALPVSHSSARPAAMPGAYDFTEVVKKTKDAVVHVRNTKIVVPVYEYYYGWRQGQPYKQEGTGSGVIISPNGYIVTNYHVVKDATELEVTLNNRKKYRASIVGIDPQNDLAVLKIDAENLPYMIFGDSDALELGEWVLAIGNPFNLGTTVTAGIVSAKARDIKGTTNIDSFIQTDAVVNPGNSGGALVNERGELVGINTMIFSMTGAYIGYSFAIPSNIVKKVTEDIIEYGSIQKGRIGISGVELNDEIAKRLGISRTEGIFIQDVDPSSSTYRAGVRPGDIIIGINGQKITAMSELIGFLKTQDPGTRIKLQILHPDGTIEIFPIVLEKYDTAYIKSWGIVVKTLSQKFLRDRGIKSGVLISDIQNRQLLANGIRPGNIILKINNHPVYSADEAARLFEQFKNRQIAVEILNDRGEIIRYIFD
ncbi:MAG: PDZ domain-containing protein [Chlorobi bacterium]|nr:PDZ domain-containing protein [Chlorobiota bacterium]